jgi:hypothetical protein
VNNWESQNLSLWSLFSFIDSNFIFSRASLLMNKLLSLSPPRATTCESILLLNCPHDLSFNSLASHLVAIWIMWSLLLGSSLSPKPHSSEQIGTGASLGGLRRGEENKSDDYCYINHDVTYLITAQTIIQLSIPSPSLPYRTEILSLEISNSALSALLWKSWHLLSNSSTSLRCVLSSANSLVCKCCLLVCSDLSLLSIS